MTFPIAHTVIRKPYTGEEPAPSGIGYAPAFGSPVVLGVYTIAPHMVEQGSATATETAVADVDVAMPKSEVNLKDRFTIDGDDYEVVGVNDYTRGFHGWTPGIVVELRRVT